MNYLLLGLCIVIIIVAILWYRKTWLPPCLDCGGSPQFVGNKEKISITCTNPECGHTVSLPFLNKQSKEQLKYAWAIGAEEYNKQVRMEIKRREVMKKIQNALDEINEQCIKQQNKKNEERLGK